MALVIEIDRKTKIQFEINTDELLEFLMNAEGEIDIEEARTKIDALEMFIIDKPGNGMGVRRMVLEFPKWLKMFRRRISSSSSSGT